MHIHFYLKLIIKIIISKNLFLQRHNNSSSTDIIIIIKKRPRKRKHGNSSGWRSEAHVGVWTARIPLLFSVMGMDMMFPSTNQVNRKLSWL